MYGMFYSEPDAVRKSQAWTKHIPWINVIHWRQRFIGVLSKAEPRCPPGEGHKYSIQRKERSFFIASWVNRLGGLLVSIMTTLCFPSGMKVPLDILVWGSRRISPFSRPTGQLLSRI